MSKHHPTRLVRGANLTDCIRFARQLGCTVEPVHGTGEIRFSHPLTPKLVNTNGRRKSAPRAVTTWLNDLLSVLQRDAVA